MMRRPEDWNTKLEPYAEKLTVARQELKEAKKRFVEAAE